jgi:peptide/nickel transport system substrate-binding protein
MGEDRTLHPYLPTLLRAFERGCVGRREFLRTATLLGMSATAAYGIAGSAPARAPAQTPRKGGRLRLAMRLGDISDPHTYSWVSTSSSARRSSI